MESKVGSMNVLQYVNSKDIRAHLEKIGYTFSPTEAAWLIFQSRNHTLAEKHAAWRELTEEYPNAVFNAKYTVYADAPPESLSDYLRLYIDTEEKLLLEFSKNDGSFVYCVEPLDEDSIVGGVDEVFTRAFSDFSGGSRQGNKATDIHRIGGKRQKIKKV